MWDKNANLDTPLDLVDEGWICSKLSPIRSDSIFAFPSGKLNTDLCASLILGKREDMVQRVAGCDGSTRIRWKCPLLEEIWYQPRQREGGEVQYHIE